MHIKANYFSNKYLILIFRLKQIAAMLRMF